MCALMGGNGAPLTRNRLWYFKLTSTGAYADLRSITRGGGATLKEKKKTTGGRDLRIHALTA